MKTFGKIIIACAILGVVEQVVYSISDSFRPNPIVPPKKAE